MWHSVESKDRFEFGKNWQHFLCALNQNRVKAAEESLRQMLGRGRLDGQTFLDVGTGSGLFSLAARRLGARVLSFDYDQESVACALRLRNMFSSSEQDWHIERGSALDREYLRALGDFDVVYAWGVLHHTGAMWQALRNMTPLVKQGGRLFIAIYNDQGKMSDIWRIIKKTYNRAPRALRFLILWPTGLLLVAEGILADVFRLRVPRIIFQSIGPRGMSRWRDIVDWVGGYPFEVATRTQIVSFYRGQGFRLDRLVSCGRKSGCNQFVFVKGPERETGERQHSIDAKTPAAMHQS
jgi:2-polyprenyl-3-methyl-5-hydroxy-6-metoxy-1,4-benzoquinol methylase